jgi:hypothetical protein
MGHRSSGKEKKCFLPPPRLKHSGRNLFGGFQTHGLLLLLVSFFLGREKEICWSRFLISKVSHIPPVSLSNWRSSLLKKMAIKLHHGKGNTQRFHLASFFHEFVN